MVERCKIISDHPFIHKDFYLCEDMNEFSASAQMHYHTFANSGKDNKPILLLYEPVNLPNSIGHIDQLLGIMKNWFAIEKNPKNEI